MGNIDDNGTGKIKFEAFLSNIFFIKLEGKFFAFLLSENYFLPITDFQTVFFASKIRKALFKYLIHAPPIRRLINFYPIISPYLAIIYSNGDLEKCFLKILKNTQTKAIFSFQAQERYFQSCRPLTAE